MKDTIKVSWYIILTTMVLWMFVVETTKVFAHGDGKCITDRSGNVFLGLGDNSYVKVVNHLKGDELATRGRDEKDPQREASVSSWSSEPVLR